MYIKYKNKYIYARVYIINKIENVKLNIFPNFFFSELNNLKERESKKI